MLRRVYSLILILLCCSNFFFASGLKKKLSVKNKSEIFGFPVDAWVYIKSLNKDLCLTDTCVTRLTQEKCTNKESQQWKASENPNGTFTFIGKCSERAWDVKGSSTERLTPVTTEDISRAPNQMWFIERFKVADIYMFRGQQSNKCLDTRGDRELEGLSPVIYDCSDANVNQAWKYERAY